MRRAGRVEVVVFVVAAAGACASGCERREPVSSQPPILRIGAGVPAQGTRGSGLDYLTSAMTADSWLAQGADGRLTERLVREWTWSDDNTVLHLKLRKDVQLHDGTRFTPDVAAVAMRETLASGEYASFATVRSVEPTGDDSLILRLSEPNSFLLIDLSLSSVTLTRNKQTLGTGAFEMVKRDEGHAQFRAFSKYYRGRPALDEVSVTTYPTQRNAWAALMRGEIDMLHEVSREAAEFVDAESSVTASKFLRPYYNGIVFNTRHPVLSNRGVRVALNEAIDRSAIVRLSMLGQGRPASGPVWPLHWAYSTAVPEFTYDPARAAKQLDALGYTVGRAQEPGRMPSRFHFKCLLVENDSSAERIALRVQRQLYELGVDMEVVSVKPKEFGRTFIKGDFDAALTEVIGSRALNWLYILWHSPQPDVPSQLPTGYNAADGALDRFRAATDDADIRASVEAMQRVFRDDPPAIFLAWQERSRALSKAFVAPDEGSDDILGTVRQWRGVPVAKPAAK